MTERVIIGIAGLFLAASVASCDGRAGDEAYSFTRFAMDTVVEYTIIAPDHRTAREAMIRAHEEIERVENLLWEDNEESSIYQLNRTGRVFDYEVAAFLRRSLQYSAATSGAFDVTVGPLVSLYGFTSESPRLPTDRELEVAGERVGYMHVTIHDADEVQLLDGMNVSVGGVAKGYAVDRAVAVLRKRGITSALVNAGGDMYALGNIKGRPWRIGIRDPDDPNEIIEVLHVSDAAVATSGDYQRYFERDGTRYHHILDPSSGRPARHLRSSTVVAPTAEEADALATALFVTGRSGLGLFRDVYKALIVMPDGEVIRTY
jgi:FAD:protein FMN transferase